MGSRPSRLCRLKISVCDESYVVSSQFPRVCAWPKHRPRALPNAITGERFPKKLTSHDLRRTVATRLAEVLGDAGTSVIKRVLGHSDGSVTAIYNRYGYVREMRRVLEQWADDLTGASLPLRAEIACEAQSVQTAA